MWDFFNLTFLVWLFFLLATNPERSELDSHVLEGFKFSFYRGISNFFNVNVRSSFSRRWFSDDDSSSDENYVNALLFSYVHGGNDKLYLGIGGIWIEPAYWTTLSGYICIAVCCLTLFRIVTRTRRVTELSSLTQGVASPLANPHHIPSNYTTTRPHIYPHHHQYIIIPFLLMTPLGLFSYMNPSNPALSSMMLNQLSYPSYCSPRRWKWVWCIGGKWRYFLSSPVFFHC